MSAPGPPGTNPAAPEPGPPGAPGTPGTPGAAAADAEALEHALGVLAAHSDGVLQYNDHAQPLRFVLDSATGRPVAPVASGVLFAAQHVLFVPEESDEALQLLLTPEEAPESAATDRWQTYHGSPDHVHWASFWIDGARHGAWVFDGDAFARANTLAHEEPHLCKAMNADHGRLSRLCRRFAGMAVPSPTCVGVDPRGVHVRARFGVIRVRFPEKAGDAAHARRMIDDMLREAGPA